jgi:hypothetical protein
MPSDILDTLCHDLRRLREQAGGPSLREVALHIGLGKSQVCAILNGNIRRPPDWRVVRGLVEICYRHARERGRWPQLSINAGLDEYWRLRFALVEHAAGHARRLDVNR